MQNKQKRKLKVGDEVIINAGKDKGRTGKILRFVGDRVVVENANMVKKCVRPNPQIGENGGIISVEAALHYSNVNILNPRTNKRDKVGYKTLEDGKKVRIFRTDAEVIDRLEG